MDFILGALSVLADLCTVLAFVGAMALWVWDGMDEGRAKPQDGTVRDELSGGGEAAPETKEGRKTP